MLKVATYLFALSFSLPLWAVDFANIQVHGKASISALPDYATLNATIRHTAKTKAQANSQSEQQLVRVVDALKGLGIDAKAIDASSNRAYPSYQYQDGKREKLGETSEYSLQITINDIDSLAKVFHELNQQEISHIENAQFYFNDINALQQQALIQAIDVAYQKARTIAKSTQHKLDKVYQVVDHITQDATPQFRMLASESHNEAAQYQKVKPQTIHAQVTIIYKLD